MGSVVVVSSCFKIPERTEQQRREEIAHLFALYLHLKESGKPPWKG